MSDSVCIAGFGEIMMRISPSDRLRFAQAMPGMVSATFGGGEANVCASLAQMGMKSRYLTALPSNAIVSAMLSELRGFGVDTSKIHHTSKGRLGIYFAETGANQRGSAVVYDRAYSSISLVGPEEYNYDEMLDGVTWLHISGITPSLTENAFNATLNMAKKASEKGIKVSCDLNFRKKLWKWCDGKSAKELARECMGKIVPYADVIIGNEEDAADVFDIHAEGSSVESGKLNIAAYTDVAKKLSDKFPKAKKIAITLRESISANHNNWGAMLYDVEEAKSYLAPLANDEYSPYHITDIVDRIGGGDSFCAGLIYALNTEEYSAPQKALSFAVAASCLKHSIYGDYNRCSVDEVVSLMSGNASGRVKR